MTKFFAKLHILVLIISSSVNAQYTEVINSNRPGGSYSAFSVGKNVIQGEFGLMYEKQKHNLANTKERQFGVDFAVRYGLLFEQLEIIWDGTYVFDKYTNNAVIPSSTENRSNFTRHTIGAKYLVFDPFIKLRDSINIRSWKANHGLKWKNLIPAVSAYVGANLNFGDNPLLPNDPTISPKVLIATQSHLLPRLVFVTNFMYDKISSDDPAFSYVLTLTHTFYDLKHSLFIEHQGVKSDAYADAIFRGGAARLISKNLQVDASIGMNVKNTPSRIFGALGVSYRLDHHTDLISESKRRKANVKLNPFDERESGLDTLSKSERRKLKKQYKKEGKEFPEENDSLVNPFTFDDDEKELSKSELKRKKKLEVKESRRILDSLNKTFDDKRSIQTKDILEREVESGGFIDENIDESKLSKQQLKDLKKARKERAKNEQKALKEEARKIKDEEKRIQEEEKRLMKEQKAEENFFEDEAPIEENNTEEEEKPKKKKKEKRKKKKKDDEIFDDF